MAVDTSSGKRKLIRKRRRTVKTMGPNDSNKKTKTPQERRKMDPNLFEKILEESKENRSLIFQDEASLKEALEKLPVFEIKTSELSDSDITDLKKQIKQLNSDLALNISPILKILKMVSLNEVIQSAISHDPLLEKFDLKMEIKRLNALSALIQQVTQTLPLIIDKPLPLSFRKMVHTLSLQTADYLLHSEPLLIRLSKLKVSTPPRSWREKIKTFLRLKKSPKIIQNPFKRLTHYLPQDNQWKTLESMLDAHNKIHYGANIEQGLLGMILDGGCPIDKYDDIALTFLVNTPCVLILQQLTSMYELADKYQRETLLKFIEALIRFDQTYELVDEDGDGLLLDAFIKTLEKISTDPTDENLIATCYALTENHKEQARQQRSEFIQSLVMDQESPEGITNRLQVALKQYNSHRLTLRSLIKLCHDILFYGQNTLFSPSQNPELLEITKAIINLVATQETLQIYQHLDGLLEEKLYQEVYVAPEWVTAEENPEQIYAFTDKEQDFQKTFEAMLLAPSPEPQQKYKLMQQWCDMFQSHYLASLKQCSIQEISELIQGAWQAQINLVSSLPRSIQNAINVEKTIQAWVPDTIFYTIQSPKKVRKSINEMRQVVAFIVEMQTFANKHGFKHVASLLGAGLQHPSIQSLNLIPTENLLLPTLTEAPWDTLTIDDAPLLEALLIHAMLKCENYDTVFKYLLSGSLTRSFEMLIQQANRHFRTLIQPLYLTKRIYDSSCLAEDESIDWEALNEKYLSLSAHLLLPLDAFHDMSFQEVYQHLQQAIHDDLPLNIVESKLNPTPILDAHTIIETLIKKVETQSHLPMLRHLLGILEALEKKQGNLKINFHLEAMAVIKAYHQRLLALQKEGLLPPEGVSSILKDIDLCDMYIPESVAKSPQYDNIMKLIRALKKDCMTWAQAKEPEYSQAYVKILSKYLEGTQSDKIELPSEQREAFSEDEESQIDFEAFEEETHPVKIGYAQTWNIFKQVAGTALSGTPFSYENIKDSLLKAFHWAIEKNTQANTKPISNNLLHLTPNVAASVQKSVLDLVFCALDTIGKLAGPQGELTLHNLNKIDTIIETLSKVSVFLNDPDKLQSDERAMEFAALVKAKLQPILISNQRIQEKLTHQKAIEKDEYFSHNVEVNTLMHLNEDECHRHLMSMMKGQPLDLSSVLPPSVDTVATQVKERKTEISDDWDQLAQEVSDFFDFEFEEEPFQSKLSDTQHKMDPPEKPRR